MCMCIIMCILLCSVLLSGVPGCHLVLCAPQIIAHDDAPTYLLGKIWKKTFSASKIAPTNSAIKNENKEEEIGGKLVSSIKTSVHLSMVSSGSPSVIVKHYRVSKKKCAS